MSQANQVRRQVKRNALPYTVTEIGDAEDLKEWRLVQAGKEAAYKANKTNRIEALKTRLEANWSPLSISQIKNLIEAQKEEWRKPFVIEKRGIFYSLKEALKSFWRAGFPF